MEWVKISTWLRLRKHCGLGKKNNYLVNVRERLRSWLKETNLDYQLVKIQHLNVDL